MVGLLSGGRPGRLLGDDAAEGQESPMAIGLGEDLPELGQRGAPGRLRWARGGTERDRPSRMKYLPCGPGPGVWRSNPPASRAPVRRLWVATTRVHKDELLVPPVCVFCNAAKGPNLAGRDPATGDIERLFDPRHQEWPEHFEFRGPVIVGLTAIGRATVEVLNM